MKQRKGLTSFILKLKKAFRVLFEPDDEPNGNTIYQPNPDNFGSFLEVRPIWNVRAIGQRVFVERAGQPCLLEGVTLDEWQQGKFTLTGHLPRDWDLASPQILHLVFQESDDPRMFFDERRSGKLITFSRFRVAKGTPLMLLKNQSTGEVTMPTPEFECVYMSSREVNQ